MPPFLDSLFGSTGTDTVFPFEKSAGSLDSFLKNALKTGFKSYGGDRVADLTPEQQQILGQFFQNIFPQGMKGLADIAQQDSLGRAQMLLEPGRQRAVEQTQRSTRERLNVGNNLLSTGGQFAESEGVSNVNAQFSNTLAQLLPALDQIRLQAIGAQPAFAGQGMALGDIPRQLQQQELDAAYQEFLRTTPSGGPLQALMGLFAGQGGPQVVPGQPGGLANLVGAGAQLAPLWASLFGGGGGAAAGVGAAAGAAGAAGALGGISWPAIAGMVLAGSGSKFKHDIKDADNEAALDKVKKLPVYEWSYKGEKIRHQGPMAEEFKEAFNLGDTPDGIYLIDAIGTLMSAVKALAGKVDSIPTHAGA